MHLCFMFAEQLVMFMLKAPGFNQNIFFRSVGYARKDMRKFEIIHKLTNMSVLNELSHARYELR